MLSMITHFLKLFLKIFCNTISNSILSHPFQPFPARNRNRQKWTEREVNIQKQKSTDRKKRNRQKWTEKTKKEKTETDLNAMFSQV